MRVPITTVVVHKDGSCTSLHTDRFNLYPEGVISDLRRWTTIEFNMTTKLWEVCPAGDSGRVLFSNVSRSKCLDFEHLLFDKVMKGEHEKL
jgi:hypothetical protein